jgi:hypothetical protein
MVLDTAQERELPELHTYHALTRLADGRPALLVDPGSVGNLCGETWARSVSAAAKKVGRVATYNKRPRALHVQGVGNGSQKCEYDLTMPISLRTVYGSKVTPGRFVTPMIPGSDVPGLLGLISLTANRAILDCTTKQLHLCGPGDYDLSKVLPPGADSLQLEVSPSGHLVLPCCDYEAATANVAPSLALLAKPVPAKAKPLRELPPPPAYPPRGLPLTTLPPGLDS